MKMILLFLCLSISYIVIGQIDSIENEILNYKNSKPEIISKGRRLLIDKLLQEDFHKMKEIKNYLIENIDDSEYQSFDREEYWLILLWTQDFDELLSSIEKIPFQVNDLKTETTYNSMVPVTDLLCQNLLTKTIESKGLLDIIISNSNLSTEEIDFLKLLADYCILNQPNSNIIQEGLNLMSDKFFIKYPTSPYRAFIKNKIQYKVKISDFGFGYDFFIGYGAFNSSMAKHVNDYAPMGFSMDFSFKDFVLNTTFGFGFSKLNQPIVYQNFTWEKEFTINLFYPQATIGYTFFGKERFNFNPYFGVYALMVTPAYEEIQYNPALTNVYINSDASFVGGKHPFKNV